MLLIVNVKIAYIQNTYTDIDRHTLNDCMKRRDQQTDNAYGRNLVTISIECGDYDVQFQKKKLMKKLNSITVWMGIQIAVVYGAFSENGLFSADKNVL